MGRRAPWIAVVLIGCTQPRNESDAVFEAAMERFRDSRWDEAAVEFARCLHLAPDSTSARARLGEIYARTGEPLQARRVLEGLPETFRSRPEYDVLEANVLIAEGRHEEALAAARKALRSDPGCTDAKLCLARLHLRASSTMDLPTARRLCIEALQRLPRYREAERMLLQATLGLGQFEEARELAEDFGGHHPDDWTMPLFGGTASLWLRDGGAAGSFQRAVDLSLGTYADRLTALWLLKLAFEQSGGYPPGLAERYRFPAVRPGADSPVRFTDIAPAAGVAKLDRGRGSAWLDYDGDGDDDLFTVGIRSPHELYRNDGDGEFAAVTHTAGLADPRGGWGASCADYDNDGDPDLYVTRDAWEGRAPNSLYRNDGGLFVDVAALAGVDDPGSSFTSTWADFDVDGYVDLYVSDGILGDGGENALFRSRASQSFEDVAGPMGVADPGRTIGTAAGDYDGDGRPDLYVVNMGQPNRLYHNEGSRFRDRAREAGVEYPVEGGYVTLFADFDNDGLLDLFAATMSAFGAALQSLVSEQAGELNRPFLYQNEGDGTFIDVTIGSGLDRSFGTMGIGAGDVDNDGFPDLYLANGGPEMYRWEPNALFLNQQNLHFVEVGQAAGVASLGKGHGATFADFDGDGDLDLYAGLGGHYEGDVWPNSLYRNEGAPGNAVAVSLRGTRSNRSAIGARVALFSGAHRVVTEVASGFGFGSSNSLTAHLGLGARTAVDSLEVRWPSGLRQVWRDPPADRVLRLVEGQPEIAAALSGR